MVTKAEIAPGATPKPSIDPKMESWQEVLVPRTEIFAEEDLGNYLAGVEATLSEDKFPIKRGRLFPVLTLSLDLGNQKLIEQLEQMTGKYGVISYPKPIQEQGRPRRYRRGDVLALASICWTVVKIRTEEGSVNSPLREIVERTNDALGPGNHLGKLIHEPSANRGSEPRIVAGSPRKRTELAKTNGHKPVSFETMSYDEQARLGEKWGVLELKELADALPSIVDGVNSRYVNLGLAGMVVDIDHRLRGEKPIEHLDELPIFAFKNVLNLLADYVERTGIENLEQLRRPRKL